MNIEHQIGYKLNDYYVHATYADAVRAHIEGQIEGIFNDGIVTEDSFYVGPLLDQWDTIHTLVLQHRNADKAIDPDTYTWCDSRELILDLDFEPNHFLADWEHKRIEALTPYGLFAIVPAKVEGEFNIGGGRYLSGGMIYYTNLKSLDEAKILVVQVCRSESAKRVKRLEEKA